VHPKLNNIVLASSSPRRRELLAAVTPSFSVLPAETEEDISPHQALERVVLDIAAVKGQAIEAQRPESVIVAADTLVALDGVALGKPSDAAEARSHLRRLRGRAHQVFTGVNLRSCGLSRCRVVATEVRMRFYSEAEIDRTIALGVPFDKAGGYGIQDPDLRPVESWVGCYCNVMGLPLWDTRELLLAARPSIQVHEPHEIFERCASCPRRSVLPAIST
jgi:septum formation protein